MPNRTYDRKAIFELTVEHNPDLTQKDVREITNKPERTVAYWFAGGLTIDLMSLNLIRYALITSKRNVPRELNRIITNCYQKTTKWSKNNMSSNKKVTYVGEKKLHNAHLPKFIYENKKMTIAEIADKKGISYQSCYYCLRQSSNLKEESDVTGLINRRVRYE